MQHEHWAVTVQRNGETVVTIESNLISGRELQPGDEAVIEQAARHLLGFLGKGALLMGPPVDFWAQSNREQV